MRLFLSIIMGIIAFLFAFLYSKKVFNSDGETSFKDIVLRIVVAFIAAIIVAFFVQM